MSTTHDQKEEASQAESSAFGGRAILITIVMVIVIFVAFLAIALYAGMASR